MTFCLPTLEGYGIKVWDAAAMALCTVVHGLAPHFNTDVCPRGVHRIVIERLLPSQEHNSAHPPQNANSEINMFRNATGRTIGEQTPAHRNRSSTYCSISYTQKQPFAACDSPAGISSLGTLRQRTNSILRKSPEVAPNETQGVSENAPVSAWCWVLWPPRAAETPRKILNVQSAAAAAEG